jgi:KAP-like P-loop domain-containing protein
MKFKIGSPEIDPDDPFGKDDLNRYPLAENLTSLIQTVPPPFVLAIDSPWGTGKTTFIRMWQSLLKQRGIHSVYFNAWETDFSEDPLTAFIGEITEYSATENLTTGEKSIANLKRLTTYLAKRSLPLVIKAATAGVVDLGDVQKEALAEMAKIATEDVVKQYTEQKKKLDEFREAVTKLVKEITKDSADSRLVIFVDELDRCRPNYCVELLERVKHLFNTKNIVFVLSIDGNQIEACVKALYGEGIDAKEYLKRFFDLNFRLPDPDSKAYTTKLFNRFELDRFFKNRTSNEFSSEKINLIQFFAELSGVMKLSLRTREKCFTMLCVALFMTPENYFLHPVLLITLIIIKLENPALYERFCLGDATASEVMDFIAGKAGGANFNKGRAGWSIEAYLIAAKDEENSEEMTHRQEIGKPDGSERSKHIVRILSNMQTGRPTLEFIRNKIELASRTS